jgi:hypothetical protein
MTDSDGTLSDVKHHIQRSRRSAGRLAFSGIGFSAAYFLDPSHGTARRKQAIDLFKRVRRRFPSPQPVTGRPAGPRPAERAEGSLVPRPGISPQFGANGVRVPTSR